MEEQQTQNISRIFNLQKNRAKDRLLLTLSERKARLRRLYQEINSHQQTIIDALYSDFAKDSAEVKLTEIFPVLTELKFAIRNLNKWTKPHRVKTPVIYPLSKGWTQFEPRGVVLIIAPWNYPFQLAIGPLISAIAAGNSVILKPSEFSVHTANVIAEIIPKVFDESEAAVINGDAETAQALTKLPFDHIFFTGGAETGKKVMSAAAANLTSVTLELGGKSPVIVDKSANLKEAADRIIWGKFINAGQTCIAPDYVAVDSSVEKELLGELKTALENRFNSGSGNKPAHYCRLINDRHFERVSGFLRNALASGAQVFTGGTSDSEKRYIEPTILTNVNPDSDILRHEIFGPLLPVVPFSAENELIEIVDRNPNPLALYIFSNRRSWARKIVSVFPSGTAVINDTVLQFSHKFLPFGGRGQSGFGSGHGYFGFKAFSHEKPVLKQPRFSAIKMLYPPYTKKVNKLINLLIKYF